MKFHTLSKVCQKYEMFLSNIMNGLLKCKRYTKRSRKSGRDNEFILKNERKIQMKDLLKEDNPMLRHILKKMNDEEYVSKINVTEKNEISVEEARRFILNRACMNINPITDIVPVCKDIKAYLERNGKWDKELQQAYKEIEIIAEQSEGTLRSSL